MSIRGSADVRAAGSSRRFLQSTQKVTGDPVGSDLCRVAARSRWLPFFVLCGYLIYPSHVTPCQMLDGAYAGHVRNLWGSKRNGKE